MNFAAKLAALDGEKIRSQLHQANESEVLALLSRDYVETRDLPLLFSEAASPHLEKLALRSAAITAHRFGRTVTLYAPLYLSNECVNACAYCGFAAGNAIQRVTLDFEETLQEASVLHDEGFRHLLLVTGESRRYLDVHHLEVVVEALSSRFASIAIEVFPMNFDEYRRLERAGVDGLTLYQETYNAETYDAVHRGPKADFNARLAAIEAGGKAGFRTLGIGALLGLTNWREEAVALALHGRYLTQQFWRSRIAVSFPRLCPASGDFEPPHPVSDRALTHMIVGLRLALPDAELVLSTRESASIRDGLIHVGITRMSAGSRTNPGGYRDPEASGHQFEVHDGRGPAEVARAIEAAGREPVWKDFDAALRSQL